jgi:hypothetical protein
VGHGTDGGSVVGADSGSSVHLKKGRRSGEVRGDGRGLDTDGRMAVHCRSSSAQTISFLGMERVTINGGDELNY